MSEPTDIGWAYLGYMHQRVTHYWRSGVEPHPYVATALCGQEATLSYVATDAKVALPRCKNCLRKMA